MTKPRPAYGRGDLAATTDLYDDDVTCHGCKHCTSCRDDEDCWICGECDELSPPTRLALGVLKVIALMAFGAAVGDIVRWLT